MNIIYFAGGNRVETLRYIVQSRDFTVTQIYITSIESNLSLYQDFAKENDIPLTIANKKNLLELFTYKNEEVLLSVGYRFIIPKAIFSIPSYAINIHPSLLPKYKGAYSGFAIITNREKETGLTAHFLDEGVDTGDIIHQKKINLTLSDSIASMSKRLIEIEPTFVLETLLMLKNGCYRRLEQKLIADEEVFNNKRIPEDSKIDPSLALIDLIDKIRACDAERFPAYFIIDDVRVKIKLEFEKNSV